MARLCERPGCSERGAIAYGFDPDRLLVWLSPLDPDADRMRAGVLCMRHADAMVVPLGWTLDDARDPNPRLFRPAKQPRTPRRQADAPRRARPTRRPSRCRCADAATRWSVEIDPALEERTVAEVTGVSGVDDPDATVAMPWKPEFDEHDDLDGLLDARTPLLDPGVPRPGRQALITLPG